ncbi:hypothetical protein A2U01_0103657, partial [Trifolium medium]|nr:hypothetical protein [Trifolium medium]
AWVCWRNAPLRACLGWEHLVVAQGALASAHCAVGMHILLILFFAAAARKEKEEFKGFLIQYQV